MRNVDPTDSTGELLRERERFAAIIESVPGVVWEAWGMPDAASQRINFVSDYVTSLLGYSVEEWLATPNFWLVIVHPDDRDRAAIEARAIFESDRRPGLSRFRWVRKDGCAVWVEAQSTVIRDAEGNKVGMRGVTYDVSRQVAAEQRFARLADASAALASSLDMQATLRTVTRLVVPALADMCLIHLVRPDGQIEFVELAHVDPDVERRARAIDQRRPVDPRLWLGFGQALEGAARIHVLDPSTVGMGARDEAEREALQALGMWATLMVPLASHRRPMGVLTLVSCSPDRVFGTEELLLAEELGRRCGVAVDNAHLFEAARTEVEQRQRAEAALQAEKERLAVTLRSIDDGVISTDASARVVLMNAAAEAITGLTWRAARGRPIDEVVPMIDPKTRELVEHPITAVLSTGALAETTRRTTVFRKGGAERLLAASASPIRNQAGEGRGAVLVFRDVTDQERIAAELQRGNTLASLGVLAGGIAHDFNNILTALLANLSLAHLSLPAGDPVERRVAAAERAALRARDLTQQLLTFAKGGAPIRTPTSIAEVVRESAGFVLSGSASRARYALDPDPWVVEVDAGQISQVVHNLVLNAVQAMPSGGFVDIAVRNVLADESVPLPPGRYVQVEVRDIGAGIPAEHLPKIFDPFFTTRAHGTGLGLATAHAIVTRHDGHITARSDPGAGSCFTVYLPAARGGTPAPSAPEAPTVPTRGEGRVLLMDDDADVLDTLATLLGALGYEVVATRDGTEAVSSFREARERGAPFACAILDLTVPAGMGGVATMEALLAIDPTVRAIVSSGYSEDPVMSHHARHGFVDVMPKPYGIHDVARIVGRVIRGE